MEQNNGSIKDRYIILIGNPGTGKSTFLNGLVKKVQFKNGFSVGKGLTQILQLYKHTDGITYGDTPGLSDVEMREKAAKEITEALSRNGHFKLFFVCTVESGRVRPDDVTTMNLVLNSIKTKVEYGIIVNKATKRFIQEVKNNKDVFKTYFGGFNTGNHKTEHFHYLERKDDLEDMDNVIPHLPQELVEFIHNQVPYTLILKQDVEKIQLDEFENIKNLFEKQIEEIKEDSQKREQFAQETIRKLEEKRDEMQKQYNEQMQRFQKEQKRIFEKIEQERKENQLKMEQQQQKFNQEIQRANEEQKKLLEEQHKRFQQQLQQKENERKQQEERMNRELEELRNRPPQVIHHSGGGGRRGCIIF